MPEILKTVDERERQQKTKTKEQRCDASCSENVTAKWFCYAFKLGFLRLKCKASLIFKSNLELALSIILKERELYESKHVAVACRCLKIFLLCFLI